MNKILTISVAAYNAENDIERCLNSMVNTSVADKLEIIIVNDGSSDNTLQIAREYANRYPDIIIVINKENGGHGSTINASIRAATGKYYKIVDSDDWVDSKGIELLVEELEKTDADLILNPYHEVNASTLKRSSLIKPYSNNVVLNQKRPINDIDDIVIYMHSTTYKTEIIQRMGPIIDENCFYVDMEYTLLPLRYVKNYICFSFPVYQYLLGTTTQSMNKDSLIKRRDQHRRVSMRVIDFYEKIRGIDRTGIQKIVLIRVRYAMLNQYKIYFNMKGNESIKEIYSFDKWVRLHSKDVYSGPEGRLMKVIKFNRATGFVFYPIINTIMRIMRLEPKL